ncbi:MAG: DEAD/DEAH box helicase family protein [Agathobacter sp.]|nr:DEAD/DEAH box helicase family protein [Agathobacter sp.]
MDYSNILKFKYTWRKYQARVLENTREYVADGKVHIVAAPGSGKTTLGIELIARMKEAALVLAPSITIREQWKERIVDGFLLEGLNPDDYISQDLKNPRAITIATYQALHSAMNRYKGSIDESGSAEDDTDADDVFKASAKDVEEVDYSDFDIVKTMKANKIGLVCLDECHHLRSEWWKALEELKKEMGGFKVIALTATPPYDSNATMWNRYMNMCGEIDEEIAIPELVKEGSLCPHQDFVYFNYPTKEEREEVEKFKIRSKEAYEKLMGDAVLAEAVQSHRGLCGLVSDEELLEKPNYFAAILIYLQAKNIPFPERLKRLLGTRRLPEMEASWLELLLQGFLYEDVENYTCDENYRKELISYLKAEGVIEKKKVSFTTTPSIEKLLTTSKGKCESIKDIVAHEYKADGKDLRLLVLTDYIRKEYEKALGTDADVMSLGVIPFFEQLRRSVGTETDLRLGVLCGTIVIIPAEAKEALVEAVGDSGKITFSKIGNLSEEDYVKVNVVGDAHFLTGAVTDIFTKGCMQVLIGTKSLLGEGWDSPCINSLILASFVGSFMLSNQMRGRAIRVFKQNPEKTSNIWHLVCLSPWKDASKGDSSEISEDYALLERRMDHFLGLHYTEDIIENGMDRLSIITPPFNEQNVAEMNQKMLELSGERATLKDRWNRSLSLHRKMDIVEETAVAEASVPKTVFKENLRGLIFAAIALAVLLVLRTIFAGSFLGLVATIGIVVDVIYAMTKLPKLIQLMNAEKRLFAFGNGIRKALLKLNLMEGSKSKVKVESDGIEKQTVYLSGGTGRDKTLFTKCVNEFFGEIENQRYLLVRSSKLRGAYDFYAVPECFAKRKEDAMEFYNCIKPYMGKYELVYTRSETGRPILLEGRMKALANQKNKTKSYKRVKDF